MDKVPIFTDLYVVDVFFVDTSRGLRWVLGLRTEAASAGPAAPVTHAPVNERLEISP